jgi:hypothetical protein
LLVLNGIVRIVFLEFMKILIEFVLSQFTSKVNYYSKFDFINNDHMIDLFTWNSLELKFPNK